MRRALLILGFTISFASSASQTTLPDGMALAGWKVLLQTTGDLNQDGLADNVLVVELDDPKNRKRNEGLGAPSLNLNPRRLIVFLRVGPGYKKVADVAGFVPSENSDENSCLADVLENGGVNIKRGLLLVEFQYWASCGSWGVTNRTFSFRYDSGRFRLVGVDESAFMRNSGDATRTSTNYLTGKQKQTGGLNESDGPSKPETTWKMIAGPRLFYLDSMSSDCYSEIEATDTWCK